EHVLDGGNIRADRVGVVGVGVSDELKLAGVEYLSGDSEAVEFEGQKCGRNLLARGYNARDRFGVTVAVVFDRAQKPVSLAGEGRDNSDDVILPPNPAIDFVHRLREVGAGLQHRAAKLQNDYFVR